MGIIPVDNNKGNSVASVDTVDFSQFTNPAANAEKGLAMAEAMDFDFGEIIDEVTTEVKESVSTEELAQAREQNGQEIDPTQLTEDDIKALVGSLSPEEYDKFIGGIEDYYDEQVNILENILKTEDGNGLEDMYDDLNAYTTYMFSGYADQTYLSQMEEKIKEKYGVSGYSEIMALKTETEAKVNEIKEAINMSKNLKDTAKYDYLMYLDSYNSYNSKKPTEAEIADLDKCKHTNDGNLSASMLTGPLESYNYKDYVKIHPDVTPAEFVQMVRQVNKNAEIYGISDVNSLEVMAEVADRYPDMLKKYEYLYNEDPAKAEQYLKDIKYQTNNIQGQLEAEKFLEQLYSKDEEEALTFLANEFGVHLEGLEDGIDTFLMGLYHAGEAAFGVENRVMDVGEYKKMYILQALMTKEDKIKCGILNEDGTAKDPNSIIDFTDEYAGALLKNNYEISQGIGNMLPSVLISMVNPAAGSVAMGISAGGNAYHGAMVQGSDYLSALFYGAITGSSEAITERLLGGLPGLSNIEVTGGKTLLQAMGKEGSQEMFQGVLDSIVRNKMFGDPLPQTWEELKEYGLDIGKQGLYGALTAGYMQLPSAAINTMHINYFNKYMKSNNITIEEYTAAIEALKKNNPSLNNISEEQFKIHYFSDVVTQVNVNKLKSNISIDSKIELLNSLSGKQLVDVMSKINDNTELVNQLVADPNTPFMINLTQELLEPTLNYYEQAAKLVADNGDTYASFIGYRNHREGHVKEVAGKTMEAALAIQESLNNNSMTGFSSDVNLYECYVAAIWHDTGMAAGAMGIPGLDSYYDENGNIQTKVLVETKAGNTTRGNHSFNSAMMVLMNANVISELGVDPNVVALLCFSHSKSNSGVAVLNNASDWSHCISKIENAVEFYNSQNPKNPITFANGKTSFVESLVDSGILVSTESTEGITKVKNKIVKFRNYKINNEALQKLASEAFALRLGDANTNNNNLGDNQGGQKIDLESTVGDFNPVFEIKDAKFKNIDALVFAETMGLSYDEVIERMKLPEENPNHLEIFKSKSNISVEIGGKRIQLSPGQAAFIYGEHNIDFSTKVNDDGMLVEQFTIKDPTKVPASTLYNLKERFGELQTAADGGYLTSVEILLNGENVPESQREEIQNYYNQYLKSKGYPGSKVSWSN